ncbi:MAG: biotin/lipoyl-containing protein [Bacillota bacterium]
MKKLRVTVDGHTYIVSVEELSGRQDATAGDERDKTGGEVLRTPADRPTAKDRVAPTAQPNINELQSAPADAGLVVPAPMPGSIVNVSVKTGDTVEEDAVLLILEAMKMENEITAPKAGQVVQVLVEKGATVNSGDPLIVIA